MLEKIEGFELSVVIPMYNSKNTIKKTLDSVKEQSAFNNIIEVIVVNDGSKDNSLNIVKEYMEKNNVMPIIIIDKENAGVSAARNDGMLQARGNWIALLDSDDRWLPNKIEIQLNIIQENSNIDFLGGNLSEKELKFFFRKIEKLYKANVKDLCLKNFPQTSIPIFKKTIFSEIGGFDENQSYAEDGNYFMKICSKYNYYHFQEKMIDFGDGKREFGDKGLSANLKKMHEGTKKNIKELYGCSEISLTFYIFLRIFYLIKYMRRILITNYSNGLKT